MPAPKDLKKREEWIANLRASHSGNHLSVKTREKIGVASTKRWKEDSERRIKQSKRMISDNPMFDPETREKIRVARIGVLLSEEIKQNMRHPKSEEGRANIKAACNRLEVKEKHRITNAKPEVHVRRSVAIKKYWQNPEWKERQLKAMLKGQKIKPNISEICLNNILQEFFYGEYKYIGDGEFIINDRCPDFININGQKKIIEMFGDFWHGEKYRLLALNDTSSNEEHEKEKIDYFAKYGYQTLIVWEHELKDIDDVVDKIKKFTKL